MEANKRVENAKTNNMGVYMLFRRIGLAWLLN